MGTGEPPNQQGQDQSINAATLAFKEEAALLSSVWALTGLEMALPPLVNHPLWRSRHAPWSRSTETKSGGVEEVMKPRPQLCSCICHKPRVTAPLGLVSHLLSGKDDLTGSSSSGAGR